jgi:hypothetical protein
MKGLFTVGMLLALAINAASAQTVQRMEIALAGTEIVRTDQPVFTIAVGDPSIADVSLVNEKAVLITGKKIGTTGFVLLDRGGTEIVRRALRVGAEQKPVRIFDGTATGMAFVCAPLCTPAEKEEAQLARGMNANQANAPGQGAGASPGAGAPSNR